MLGRRRGHHSRGHERERRGARSRGRRERGRGIQGIERDTRRLKGLSGRMRTESVKGATKARARSGSRLAACVAAECLVFADAAVADLHDLIAEGGHVVGIVRDQAPSECRAGFASSDNSSRMRWRSVLSSAENGSSSNSSCGLRHQRPRKCDTLFLSAGKLRRIVASRRCATPAHRASNRFARNCCARAD